VGKLLGGFPSTGSEWDGKVGGGGHDGAVVVRPPRGGGGGLLNRRQGDGARLQAFVARIPRPLHRRYGAASVGVRA
jgi:hypothetical protein